MEARYSLTAFGLLALASGRAWADGRPLFLVPTEMEFPAPRAAAAAKSAPAGGGKTSRSATSTGYSPKAGTPPMICYVHSTGTASDGGDFAGSGCSGTLIAPTWLATAAHCFSSIKDKSYRSVRVGCGYSGGGETTPFRFAEEVQITRVKFDEAWDTGGDIVTNAGGDFAFLKLDRPPGSIRPMRLPTGLGGFQAEFMAGGGSPGGDASELKAPVECRFTGFGYDPAYPMPRFYTSDQSPGEAVLFRLRGERIELNAISADTQPIFHGDSGGALYCRKSADAGWVLVGITSAGDSKGRTHFAFTASDRFQRFWRQYKDE